MDSAITPLQAYAKLKPPPPPKARRLRETQCSASHNSDNISSNKTAAAGVVQRRAIVAADGDMVGTERRLTVVAPIWTHSEPIQQFAYRGALKYKLGLPSSPSKPNDNQAGEIFSPSQKTATTPFIAVGRTVHAASMPSLTVPHISFLDGELPIPETQTPQFKLLHEGVVADEADNGITVAVLEDPAYHFNHAWNALHTEQNITSGGQGHIPPMLTHFNDYDFYGNDKFVQFKNPQTFAYFGVRFPKPEQFPAMAAEMERRFRLVMITDKMADSLLLAQKLLCWAPSDAVSLAEPLKKPPKTGVLVRIRQFNSADTYLYNHFTARLQTLTHEEVGFEKQKKRIVQCESDLEQRCYNLKSLPLEEHALWAQGRRTWPSNGQCPPMLHHTERTPTELVDECRPLFLQAKQLSALHLNMENPQVDP
jgi:hypothetical protein